VSLQSKYRLERDKIFTVENDKYFFAYQIVENEFHVLEIYIKEELRGHSEIYFSEIVEFIKTFKGIKYIVGYIIPLVENSERSMMSLLKFGFRLIHAENKKITLIKEV
jgi:hypothetical protein